MLVADGVVIGIEEHPEGRLERPEIRFMALQDQGLEKPGGVPEVPLGRAGVGHRLDAAVFIAERRGELHAAVADMLVMLDQVFPIHCAVSLNGVLPEII